MKISGMITMAVVLLVVAGCEPVDLSSGFPVPGSGTSVRQGRYNVYIEWSVLPNPWQTGAIDFSTGKTTLGHKSYDTDGPWRVGSTTLTYASGDMQSGEFRASWTSIQGQDRAAGSISLTLNANGDMITAFSARNEQSVGYNMSDNKIQGSNIPLVSDGVFEVTGSAVRSHLVASGLYMRSWNFLGAAGVFDGSMTPFNCNATSFIRIRLVAAN